jgi:putative ABC transport system permease protein
VADDRRINLQAIPQKKYFADQASTAVGVKMLGDFIALIMGIGACFAAMNMMYGSVMARSREVATLRAIGFRRRNILASFLVESLIVGLLGGVAGCILALPVHGLSAGTANFQTFSEVLFHFRLTPGVFLRGLIFAAAVGVLGGYLPARRAARIKLVQLLRD